MAERTPAARVLAEVPAEPGVAKPDPILVVDGLARRFGGVMAVDVDHLEIQRGAITAMIGPDGAGASTLLDLLTGFDRAGVGRGSFEGIEVTGQPPHRVARRGMVRTFRIPRVLPRMTCLDNVLLGAPRQRGERLRAALLPWTWREEQAALTGRADELLARFGLEHVRDAPAGTLPAGHRTLLELARALMQQPTMLVLDDPVAAMSPALAEQIREHIRDLPGRGVSVLIRTHDLGTAVDVSDWVVALAQGRVVAEGSPQVIARSRIVIDEDPDGAGGDRGPIAPSAAPTPDPADRPQEPT